MSALGREGFGDLLSRYGIEIRSISAHLTIVIFRELPANRGASVMNIIEHLATEIYNTYLAGIPLLDLVWVLRHPPENSGGVATDGAYEQVILQWDGHHFRSPKRIPLPRESWELYGLTGESL